MSALRSLGRQLKRNAQPEHSPIGLEFGADGLHMVQLGWDANGKPVFRAQVALPYVLERQATLDSPAAAKKLIKRALAKAPFKGRNVVTALATDDTRLLSITYQTRPGESDDAAIAKLMAERIDDDLNQFVIDYIPVRAEARDGDRLALVVISERSNVIKHLDVLRNAGLKVDALEIVPVAIRRMVSTVIADDEDVLVINVGEDATHLVVVSGRRLLFEQHVDFGVTQVTAAVTQALDLPQTLALDLVTRRGLSSAEPTGGEGLAETGRFNTVLEIVRPQFQVLVNEIRRALLFTTSETRGGKIHKAFLLGSIAAWPGATDLLAELTSLNVSIPPPLAVGKGVTLDGSELSIGCFIATGLALRGWQTDA